MSKEKDLLKLFLPPPELTISEWADQNRYLSSEASEPGKWDTSKAEFQRGIMDAVSSPDYEIIIVMSSSQVGKTEIILNTIGYYADQQPCGMLIVQPTSDPMASDFSKDRLTTMFRDTPCLANKFNKSKTRNSDNTLLHKKIPGGHVTITGANSAASLASRPIPLLCEDEIDRYPPTVGNEGDPCKIVEKRTLRFNDRKILKTSTPTIKNLSRIEEEYLSSDQQKFFVPCPHCSQFQVLKWSKETVKWNRDDKGNNYPETAVYICEHCGGVIDDVDRWNMVSKGEWRPTATSKNPKKIGFHIWAAYFPGTELKQIVREFMESKDNKETLQVFVNTVLGEPFEDFQMNSYTENDLYNRRERYDAQVPLEALLLTCAVDVQGDRLEGEVKGWGKGEENWAIDFFTIYGSPNNPQTWTELHMKLMHSYIHESGLKFRISATFVDSGYLPDEVYKFCKEIIRRGLRVYPVKGKGDQGRPIISRPSVVKNHNVKLFIIGTNAAKERVFSRINIEQPGPGYLHYPYNDTYDQQYFKQIFAETKKKKFVKGRPVYEWHLKPGVRNEALDLTVYNFALIEMISPNFEVLQENLLERLNKEKKVEKSVKSKSKRRSGWVTGL
jgi:phage terminase large subunit GpA-like protein